MATAEGLSASPIILYCDGAGSEVAQHVVGYAPDVVGNPGQVAGAHRSAYPLVAGSGYHTERRRQPIIHWRSGEICSIPPYTEQK